MALNTIGCARTGAPSVVELSQRPCGTNVDLRFSNKAPSLNGSRCSLYAKKREEEEGYVWLKQFGT